jgi:hypothetical protein
MERSTWMADLQKFEEELRTEHAELTQAFEAAQIVAEQAWLEQEQRSLALTQFREKYGLVLKALDAGAVKVEG